MIVAATCAALLVLSCLANAADPRPEACYLDWVVTEFHQLLQIAHCRVLHGSLQVLSLDFSLFSSHVRNFKGEKFAFSHNRLFEDRHDAAIVPGADVTQPRQIANYRYQLICKMMKSSLMVKVDGAGNNSEFTADDYRLQVEEIRGFLIVAHLLQLESLAFIFPELRMIRGDQLWSPPSVSKYVESLREQVLTQARPAYSLVVYDTDLTDLGLYKLQMIVKGDVHILDNKNLCLFTISWEALVPNYWNNDQFRLLPHAEKNWQSVFVWRNAPKFACFSKEFCPQNCRSGCWNATLCQPTLRRDCVTWRQAVTPASFCCHSECLIDCVGKGADRCRFCRNYRRGNFCVSACEANEVIIRDECIERRACEARRYMVHNGKCVAQCPSDLCVNQTTRECIPCTTCVSTHFFLRTMDRAAELQGCRVLYGNVTISFDSENRDLLKKYLGQVESIKGFLLVQNSALESLEFLDSLKEIEGFGGQDVEWTFQIIDNAKLKSIWNTTRHPTLHVRNGEVRMRGNKMLCTEVIENFAANLAQRVDYNPNEFKDQCDRNFALKVFSVGSTSIIVSINDTPPRAKYDYNKQTYYYVVSFRQFIPGTESSGEGWDTKSEGPSTIINIGMLEPFVTYAIFAERYSINRGYARSDIIYQRTLSAAPGMPTVVDDSESVSATSSTISLRWLPPSNPNGIIKRYYIQYTEMPAAVRSPTHCASDKKVNVVTITVPRPELMTKKACVINRTNVTAWFEMGRQIVNDSAMFSLTDRLVSAARNEQNNDEKLMEELEGLLENQTQRTITFIDTLLGKHHMEHSSRYRDNLNQFRDILSPQNYTSRKRNSTASKSNNTHLLDSLSRLTKNKPSTEQKSEEKIPKTAFLSKQNKPNTEQRGEEKIPKTPVGFETIRKFNVNDSSTITLEQPTTLTATIPNLKRFTNYEIYIYACQDNSGNRASEICSPPARAGIMTEGVPQYDEVNDSTIMITRSSRLDTYVISWERPLEPNGDIWIYNLELSVGEAVIARYCVEGDQPDKIRNRVQYELTVKPGNYAVRIQSMSSYGPSTWTAKHALTAAALEEADNLLIAISSSCAVTMILVITLVAIHARRRHIREKNVKTSINPDYMAVTYEVDEWELDRERLSVIRELGQGAFGMVYEGSFVDKSDHTIRVALKTSCASTLRERIDFLKEASLMKEFTECNHVVRLIGVVSRSQPVTVVMELMENGDLKTFLRRHRPDADKPIGRPPPTNQQRIQIAAQIADGMAYLSARKFVHRDLAARNCMVHADFTVKIGDFGLARDVYETDYYKPEQSRPLPIRWMSPEAIHDGLFSCKSDIWSFGVVLWEIVTLAAQPYAGLTNEQVAQAVVGGMVLERPDGCNDALYALMLRCWRYSPRSRPDFAEVLDSIEADISYRFCTASWYFSTRNAMRNTVRSCTESTIVVDRTLEMSLPSNTLNDQDTQVRDEVFDCEARSSVITDGVATISNTPV